ncbi:response regulator [Gilvibacter sp.]|uniref:response regulator n=1 Tax=Gilvibacter sp. TaxID=2729997 RepID=UPI003F4A81F7
MEDKKILLIEDDTILRENTAELLELEGYQMITAPNGKRGISEALREIPDLIICDIMMPEIDGYGVLEALSDHHKTKHIPFIFLSAKTEHKEVRLGMDMGADDYLTKPCEEEDLLSAIRSRLAKSTLLQAVGEQPQQMEQEASTGNLKNLPELIAFLNDKGELQSFDKGKLIYEQGDRIHQIYLINSGVVKCFTMDENGKELITSLRKEGSFLGLEQLLENGAHHESTAALESSELLAVSKQEFVEILHDNQQLTLELINLLADDINHIKEQLLQMAYGSVRRKTAQTILQFAEILNDNTQEQIRISRHDLASVAGIATESLIRTLSQFKKNGWIAIEGRNIKILDLEALELME